MKSLGRHWKNPWKDAIPVPIEELVECVHGIDQMWSDMSGSSFIMTKELMLKHWESYGEYLDAYILPCASGYHSIGIRYGNKGNEYLSPLGNQEKVEKLLKKYL